MQRSGKLENFLVRNERIIVLLLIAAGAFVRLIAIGQNPVGLNQDEASAGYEAFALLTSGIDRNGIRLPVLFISWGSGQNVLYSYLSMPFIALFGLNAVSIRLVAALCGITALPIFYVLAKRLRGVGFGLTALFMLALNPWHIMISRWALESNLLPFFLLLGIYFTAVSADKPKFLFAAAGAFGISLYAYGTAYIFLPTFLVLSAITLIRRKKLSPKIFIPAFLLFIAIALPITLCNIINVLGMEEIRIWGMTLPILTETRQSATTIFGGGGLSQALLNFAAFIKLLLTQSDGLLYNSIKGFGLYYFFGLPTAALGVGVSVYGQLKKRGTSEIFMLFAFFSGFLAAFFISININRVNMAFLPLIYFSALGIYEIIKRLGAWGAVPAAGVILCFSLFLNNYFTDFRTKLSPWFFEGLGEAIEYAESLGVSEVYVTNQVNAPYIYVLFYNEIPPEEFNETVLYANPDGGFRAVYSFGKYRFYGDLKGADTAFILTKNQAEDKAVLAEFGNYVVAADQ